MDCNNLRKYGKANNILMMNFTKFLYARKNKIQNVEAQLKTSSVLN